MLQTSQVYFVQIILVTIHMLMYVTVTITYIEVLHIQTNHIVLIGEEQIFLVFIYIRNQQASQSHHFQNLNKK